MTTLTKELLEKDGQQSKMSPFKRLFKKNKTHPGTASEADTMSRMVSSIQSSRSPGLSCNALLCTGATVHASPQPEAMNSVLKDDYSVLNKVFLLFCALQCQSFRMSAAQVLCHLRLCP